MTIKKQELCSMIETLPEELSSKVIDYIEYLKFTTVINNAPQNLTMNTKGDLRKKLEEGIEDSENGNVCSIDEAFLEVEKILEE